MTKTCFIISSIGSEKSEIREKANEKRDFVFKPVLEELGYDTIRSDDEDIPGSISRQIVERIINSEIVIADISDENPNVFYELAVRNAVNKPVIIIKSITQKPPFDIQDTRAISIDMSKPAIWQNAKEQLKKQIQEAEKDPTKTSQSILSDFTFDLDVDKSPNTEQEMILMIKDLGDELRRLRVDYQRTRGLTMRDISLQDALEKSKRKIHLTLGKHLCVGNDDQIDVRVTTENIPKDEILTMKVVDVDNNILFVKDVATFWDSNRVVFEIKASQVNWPGAGFYQVVMMTKDGMIISTDGFHYRPK